ncbi:MAG TPA: phosphatidylserine decarboxylase [Gammaproteobacteria bacterium]|nr:phosphatidylserine decarboxylase [Gammaproteobacteria bacterium]
MAIETEQIRIAPQGRPIVLVIAVAAVIAAMTAGLWWSAPAWLLVLVAAYVLRDPVRVTTTAPLAIVSPVDGRVYSVGAATDPYLHREALLIRMRMNLRGAYVIRSPIEGKVFDQWFAANHPPQEREPAEARGARHRAVWVKTDEGDDITLVMHPGCWLCRPRFRTATGERVGHGQRSGFLLGGAALVDVYVPPSSRLDCSAGDRVLAGSTIISTLVHK